MSCFNPPLPAIYLNNEKYKFLLDNHNTFLLQLTEKYKNNIKSYNDGITITSISQDDYNEILTKLIQKLR